MSNFTMHKHEEVLRKHGAMNIEGYCLVSNYGYTFEIDSKRYDARYWANCYGVALNRWMVDCLTKDAENPGLYLPMDEHLKRRIEDDLNALGE